MDDIIIHSETPAKYSYIIPFKETNIVYHTLFETPPLFSISSDSRCCCVLIAHDAYIINVNQLDEPLIIKMENYDYINSVIAYQNGFLLDVDFLLTYIDLKQERVYSIAVEDLISIINIESNNDILLQMWTSSNIGGKLYSKKIDFKEETNFKSLMEVFKKIASKS